MEKIKIFIQIEHGDTVNQDLRKKIIDLGKGPITLTVSEYYHLCNTVTELAVKNGITSKEVKKPIVVFFEVAPVTNVRTAKAFIDALILNKVVHFFYEVDGYFPELPKMAVSENVWDYEQAISQQWEIVKHLPQTADYIRTKMQ